jgi:hypothetical protein
MRDVPLKRYVSTGPFLLFILPSRSPVFVSFGHRYYDSNRTFWLDAYVAITAQRHRGSDETRRQHSDVSRSFLDGLMVKAGGIGVGEFGVILAVD